MSKSVTVDKLPPCDFDAAHGPAYADFKTKFGPWGYGCEACFKAHGVGLGTGFGQVLVVDEPAAVAA